MTDRRLRAFGACSISRRAIDRDRVVQRLEHRQEAVDRQEAVAQALVVVDEVELELATVEVAPGPQAEGERLAERAGRELGDLDEVLPVLDLPIGGEAAGVGVVEDVEARQLDEGHPGVEDRVRLAAEHLDVVAEVDQRLRQVAGVDALATDVGLAPVGEVGDAQRVVTTGAGGRHRGTLSVGLTTRSGRLALGSKAVQPRVKAIDISAVSGLPGTTTWGPLLNSSGGPVWGSTQRE